MIPSEIVVPVEAVSATVVVSSLLGYLPPLAAALGIVWYLVLLYDRFLRNKINRISTKGH